MVIKRILYVEDSTSKAMDVINQLKIMGYRDIEWVINAQKALDAIDKATVPFDLFLFDMHFDYFEVNDREAGEKLMNLLRERGFNTPVIFCSSNNWKIPGAFGNIYYHPDRFWEDEVKELFKELGKL